MKAKNSMSAGNNVTNTAYDLGFDYPNHFSRLFKKKEGMSPSEYVERLRK